MQLDVRKVAQIMGVEERTIPYWIKRRKLPARRIGGQHLFDRFDLFEWAVQHPLGDLPADFIERIFEMTSQFNVEQALEAGGVVTGITGDSAKDVWREIVERLPAAVNVNRKALIDLFLTMELFHPATMCDGIAIPLPRRPLVASVPAPIAIYYRLERSIALGGEAQNNIEAIVVLLSPTVRAHLMMLGQLVRMLRDKSFQDMVSRKSESQAMAMSPAYAP